MPTNEAIFAQPDITPASDDATATRATTYTGTAIRTGRMWTATVKIGDSAVSAQGATWIDVKRNLGWLVLETLNAEPGTIGVRLEPADPDAAAALEAVTEARQARVLAEQAERDAVRRAATLLTSQGWTQSDVGSAVDLSHQRVSQILKELNE